MRVLGRRPAPGRDRAAVAVAAVLAAAASLPAAARADHRLYASGPDGDDGPTAWLDLGAFVQAGLVARLDRDDPDAVVTDDTFWLQRARVGLRAQATEWLRLRLEVDLADGLELWDAHVDMPLLPPLGVRVGRMAVPFLRTYGVHELDLGFVDRPLYVPLSPDRGALSVLTPRDTGVALYGRIGDPSPASHLPVLDYGAGVFVGDGETTARNEDGAFLYALRADLHVLGVPEGTGAEDDLSRNPFPRVAVGAAFLSACDARASWNRGFTVDWEARFQGVHASAAFVWLRNGAATGHGLGEGLGYDGGCDGAEGPMGAIERVSRGAHLQVSYALPKLIIPPDAMELLVRARADWVDPSSPHDADSALFGGGAGSPGYVAPAGYDDPFDAPTRWRLTFGLTFLPMRHYRIRIDLDYQMNREREDVVRPDGRVIDEIDDDVLWIQLTAAI